MKMTPLNKEEKLALLTENSFGCIICHRTPEKSLLKFVTPEEKPEVNDYIVICH